MSEQPGETGAAEIVSTAEELVALKKLEEDLIAALRENLGPVPAGISRANAVGLVRSAIANWKAEAERHQATVAREQALRGLLKLLL